MQALALAPNNLKRSKAEYSVQSTESFVCNSADVYRAVLARRTLSSSKTEYMLVSLVLSYWNLIILQQTSQEYEY